MSKDKLAQIFHFDLYGKRGEKYDFLNENSMGSIAWNELEPEEPDYYFTKKDSKGIIEYNKGFKINDLFSVFSNGFTTERDGITLHFNFESLKQTIDDLRTLPEDVFKEKYALGPDGRDWTYKTAKSDISNNKLNFIKALYRPFDYRATCFTGKTKGFFSFPRNEVMHNFLNKNNIGLIIPKQTKDTLGGFVTMNIAGHKSFSAYDKSSVFPLYLYPAKNDQQTINTTSGTPNLNTEIVNQIAQVLYLRFISEKEDTEDIAENYSPVCYATSSEVEEEFMVSEPPQTFAPIDILDYIYAILHSPTYREKYKEFLKIDFPRVPYPDDASTFWKLVKLGGELRQIHLLESPVVNKYITKYPVDGNNLVTKIYFAPYNYIHEVPDENGEMHYPDYLGTVYINDTQYFGDVPTSAWEFYIGGYQPAQKWLKDRKGRELNFEDILHYQKIIVALTETGRIMKKIGEIKIT